MKRRYLMLDFIINYKRKYCGNSPTLQEIADEFDTVKSVANYNVSVLEMEGKLRRLYTDDRYVGFFIPDYEFVKKKTKLDLTQKIYEFNCAYDNVCMEEAAV